MTDRLFSDIPVAGAGFQGQVDRMCGEINKENLERQAIKKTEEILVEENKEHSEELKTLTNVS